MRSAESEPDSRAVAGTTESATTTSRGRKVARRASSRVCRIPLLLAFHALSRLGDRCAAAARYRVLRLPEWLWRDRVEVTRLGLRLRLDLRDNVQRELYFTGWYERAYLLWLKRQLREGDTYVDIGAHIGIHALAMAKRLRELGGGSVIAFEPARDTAEVLRAGARRNGLSNVTVVDIALDHQEGHVVLRSGTREFHKADAAVRSLHGSGAPIHQVRTAAFDAWAQRSGILRKVDVVKIDVEGSELSVLRGMANSIRRYRPRVIGLEIHHDLLAQARIAESDITQFFQSHGYGYINVGDIGGKLIFQPPRSATAAAEARASSD
jgi:FkbM family methyltransferase